MNFTSMNDTSYIINHFVNLIKMSLKCGDSLLDVERELFKWLLKLGQYTLEKAMRSLLSDPDFVTQTHKKAKKITGPMRCKGSAQVNLTTIFGTIKVCTSHWVEKLTGRRGIKRRKRRQSGSGVYPILWMWGIYDRCTPAVQAEIARAMVICSSCEEASDLLAARRIQLHPKSICRLSYSLGRRSLNSRTRRLSVPELASKEKDALRDKRVVVAIDGGRYRARIKTTVGRKTQKGRRGFSTPWKEPKGFIIYTLDSEGVPDRHFKPLCDFVTGNADVLAELLIKYLKAYGVEKAKELVFLADGAHWIWNRVTLIRRELKLDGIKVTEVLDFYHVAQHLAALSKLPKSWSKRQSMIWQNKQLKALKSGCLAHVQKAIKELKKYVSKYAQQKISRELHYFSGNNEKRMRYFECISNQIQIGSGFIESAIRRVINQRVKSNSIFWCPENAEFIMHMRAQLKTSRFEEMIRHATSTYARVI